MRKIIGLLGIVFIVSSCSQKERKRNFICFIDLSASIDAKQFNQYAEILVHDIYENLTANDQIRIYPLDYATRIKNDPIFYEDISSIDFSKKIKTISYRESEIQELVRGHTTQFKDSLIAIILKSRSDRNNYSFETDIIGALEKVYREKIENKVSTRWNAFNNYINGDKEYITDNFVFLFSDMIHDSDGRDFGYMNSAAKADELLKNLSDDGRIPDMSKIKCLCKWHHCKE